MSVFGAPFMLIHSKHSKLDRKIGGMSYPIYIAYTFQLNLTKLIMRVKSEIEIENS